MTKKVKGPTLKEMLAESEMVLKKLEPAAREKRLRAAETDVKSAAKPKTRADKGVALSRVEAEIEASKPHDPRLCFAEMKHVKPEPTKPNAKAELIRAYRRAADAVRR
jgi:capsule polysaccharide export protein KpsE/RkpR